MTTDEAKTKWCPFASVGVSFNRLNKEDTQLSCNCIADSCMAWRWDKTDATDGYCGLAGTPP